MPDRIPPIQAPTTHGGTVIIPPNHEGEVIHNPPHGIDGDSTTIGPTPIHMSRATNQEARTRTLSFGGIGQCIPANWGKIEVGGDVVFARTLGGYVYIVQVIGRGPLQSISNFRIGEHSAPELGLVSNASLFIYTGTTSQGIDPLISSIEANWQFAMPGIAYVTYRLSIANTVAASVDPKELKVIVEGLLVRDYSQDPTLVTRYFTDNPVWIMADFFTNKRYGLGEADVNLDWAGSWSTAAAVCDVVIQTGTTAPATAPTVTFQQVGGLGLTKPGTYSWQITFRDPVTGIESLPGPATADYIPAVNHEIVTIDSIETSAGLYRRLYRTKADGQTPRRLVKEIPNDTQTTLTDFYPDASLGPYVNDIDTAKQFRLALALNSPQSAEQFIQNTRGQFQAYISFNRGQYQIFIDTDNGIDALQFDEVTISDWPTLETSGLEQIPTRVTVGYTKQQDNYKQDTAKDEDPNISTPSIEALRVEIREAKYSYYGVPSYDQAFRLAHWLLKRGQLDKRVSWRTKQLGAYPIPGSVVRVRFPALKLWDQADNSLGQAVVVTQCGPAADSVGWQLRGEFYDPTIYDKTYRNPLDPPGGGGDGTGRPPPPPPPPGSDLAMRVQFWIDNHYQPGIPS